MTDYGFGSPVNPAPSPHLVIGLMSGTSYDGIDAALVAIRGGRALRAELVAFETAPYPAAVKRLIAEVSSPETGTVDKVAQANFLVGELFAEAAIAVARKARVPMARIDLIGSHGQTIHHLPKPARIAGRRVASTLQIGEPSVIAERTGVTTVADFRPRDMACGGQGAPLVPYVDYLLFRHRGRGRLVLNIGGIANFTYLPPRCRPEQVVAFDTGPGNMLLDALTSILTHGRQSFDRGGAMAAQGTVCEPLLRGLLGHPYLRRRPPKSTGREMFGRPFAEEILRQAELFADRGDPPLSVQSCSSSSSSSSSTLPGSFLSSGAAPRRANGELLAARFPEARRGTARPQRGGRGVEDPLKAVDILATVAAFTAESVADAWRRFIQPIGPVHEVIASGGGCHNQTLLRFLAEAFAPIPVVLSGEFGIPGDAKEAIAFAVLAHETMAGRPGNLPSATGARRAVVLGKIIPGARARNSR